MPGKRGADRIYAALQSKRKKWIEKLRQCGQTASKELLGWRSINASGREEKDYVIQKRRYSGFFGTDLDLVLRENKVENVIIVGTKTNCCIRATVTDAFYLDYNPYVVKECVATNSDIVNEVHLTDIDKYLGDVVDMNTLFTMLDEGTL